MVEHEVGGVLVQGKEVALGVPYVLCDVAEGVFVDGAKASGDGVVRRDEARARKVEVVGGVNGDAAHGGGLCGLDGYEGASSVVGGVDAARGGDGLDAGGGRQGGQGADEGVAGVERGSGRKCLSEQADSIVYWPGHGFGDLVGGGGGLDDGCGQGGDV